MTNYYDFEDLMEKAEKNPNFENLQSLADWLSNFSSSDWNGECYAFQCNGKNYELRPANYKFDDDGNSEVTAWEMN